MLPGFSGHLISEQFLERHVDAAGSTHGRDWSRLISAWQLSHRVSGPATSVRALLEQSAAPLVRALGFPRLDRASFQRTIATAVLSGPAPIALIVAGWGERLDPLWRTAVVYSRSVGSRWCLMFNGRRIRLSSAARGLSRRSIEFDLELTVHDERAARAAWLILNAGSLAGTNGAPAGIESLVAASDLHAGSVCGSLRDGVIDASQHAMRALVRSPDGRALDSAFEQSLTIVYRMLFLLFVEARHLVPVWHPIYRRSYSLESLRDRAEGRSSVGFWDALRAISRLAHAGCRAGDLRVTAFNGRLFAPARTPLMERRDLDDEAARLALLALSTRPTADREGLERIAYRDLGVEQLGAVYETLLDYRPVVERSPKPSARPRAHRVNITLRPGSGVRKHTGTFYTPRSIAAYLTRRVLEPLVRDATPEQILDLRVLDPSMGSGAFLVAAAAFLGDAYESALVRTGRCLTSDLGPQDSARIRRQIAERCLFGVDLNPMAVQLARLSIWLATLAGDRPLSFLDHHLVVGDSLIGAWLPRLRQAPPSGRQRTSALPLFDTDPLNDVVRELLPVRFALATEPNETPEQVREKERTLGRLNRPGSALFRWKQIADLWCARWFAEQGQTVGALYPTLCDQILTGRCALPTETAASFLDAAGRAAAAHRFLHWELEFPEVFFDASGARRPDAGFDAVLGNPPWDMVRADADRGDRAARAADASTVRFSRDAGIYTAQSDGQANRYQLFVERSLALTRPGGRLGLVLPSGMATDHGSAPLRRLLFSRAQVDSLVGFDNTRAIFPIHRSMRFVLLSATAGSETTAIRCRLGEVDPAVLDEEPEAATESREDWFPVTVSPELLRRLSGDSLAVPYLRTPLDLALAERAAARFPPLGSATGWHARFGRELNATEDRQHFASAPVGVPIVEGKMLEPFRARLNDTRSWLGPATARRLLGDRHERARLAYRDVASAQNRVTLIAAMLPAGCASTHTVFCLKTTLPRSAQYFLCGLFNSLVVNFLVRLRVATHVTAAIVEHLPIPLEQDAGPLFARIVAAARRLERRTDDRSWTRLNAYVARLYGLSETELAHVLATFPLIPEADRNAILREFLLGS